MPYTVEQYKKDFVLAHLKDIPADDVLSRYKPKDRLAGLKPEDRLAGLSPKQVEKWLSSHRRRSHRRK